MKGLVCITHKILSDVFDAYNTLSSGIKVIEKCEKINHYYFYMNNAAKLTTG